MQTKLEHGSIISHYRILSQIGVGGMGEVYLAEDTTLGRNVAIKFLSDEFSNDEDALARFVTEAKAVSALNHPNILTVHEIGEDENSRFIVTEFIEGETLRAKLGHEDQLSVDAALKIGGQVAEALAAAHAAGIIHRDIKPDNIMIRSDGLVKVLDFGIAKLVSADSSAVDHEAQTELLAQTQAGMVIGTVAYMSPEQARGRQIDVSTDIWSLGCVLYEMLAGKKAFHGESMADVLANVIHKDPQPIADQRADSPRELDRVIARALCKRSEDRYASMSEMLADLKQIETKLLIQTELRRSGERFEVVPAEQPSGMASIAVLRFSDISTDKDRTYFSDGLTEEIIMNLSKLRELRVVSHGFAVRFAKEGKSYPQVASELGVRYLLDGSVRRHGKDLRITAQLVDAASDAYLWAETYRGTLDDIFEIQEKVAAEIVRGLQISLSPDEQQNLKRRYTDNTEAFQLYLQGRFFWNRRSEDAIRTAIRYFEKAIAIDERYALAWAGIADSYSLLGEYGHIERKLLYPKARAAVEKALEIDDGLAEVHTSLASLLMLNEWDWAKSEREFMRALELNPNYATAYHWYSGWLINMGRLDEALKMISRAADLDPISQAIVKDKGITLYYRREYEAAIELAKTTLELDADFATAHRLMSLSLQGLKRFDEAITENAKWGELTHNKLETMISLAQIQAAAGNVKEAKQLISKAEKSRLRSENTNRGMALVSAALGETDAAFEWLDKSFDAHEESLLSIKVDPKFDPIRSDPRMAELLRRMKLPV
jgi:serine/threonine protein kinase/Tfp pilus assembly protein PilF